MIGTTVSHYHVLGRLGAGAMGVVYEAEDLRLGRRVALKFLPDELAKDPENLARFEREARMASALNHPNICTIHDIGESQGSPFIVMELLEGETLRSRIAAGPLPPEEFLEKAVQIASAMAAAHLQRIVHRDLKPANIFVTRSGAVKVVDFGLAKPVHVPDTDVTTTAEPSTATGEAPELTTMPGTVLGTLAYMSPEQIAGWPADPRSDVFALGVIFYEALTARRPFSGVGFEELRQQISRRQPVSPSSISAAVSPRLEGVVLSCLEKSPDERFASAVELLRALEALRRSEPGATARAGAWQDATHAGPSRIGAVAVLPFSAGSDDPDSGWLAAGLTEDLIRDLSQLPSLRVKARSLVLRYDGQTPNPESVGIELDVDAVVAGRLARHAGELSVDVDFVRCADGSLVWGERFTSSAGDLTSIEDDVLRRIVTAIASRLDEATPPVPPRRHTPSPDAHHLYLRGRSFWNERTPDTLHRAIECFRKAVETDPGYALASSGLADAYTALAFYDLVRASDVMPRARAAAQRAVNLDPQLPEGHASLGLVAAIGGFRWTEAGHHLRTALDLNPSLAYAHHWYAMQLSTLGRGEEAYAEIKRALELDPLAPAAQGDALNVLIRARRHDDCIREAQRVLKIEPGFAQAWAALGRASQYRGSTAEAVEALEKAVSLDTGSIRLRAQLAWAHGRSGRMEPATRIRAALESERASVYVPSFWLGLVELGLGQTDAALGFLEQAFAERYPQVAYLAVEPAFDPLRREPGFVSLLDRIGLGNLPTQAAAASGASPTRPSP